MPCTWRFFLDDGHWYWELSLYGEAMPRRSICGYGTYEEAIKAAEQAGYRYVPSQAGAPRSTSIRRRPDG